MQRECLCARPVSLCAWRPPLPRLSTVRVCAVCVCVRARATISREQGLNKLFLIPTPLARGQCYGGHIYQVLRKPRARMTDRTWKGNRKRNPPCAAKSASLPSPPHPRPHTPLALHVLSKELMYFHKHTMLMFGHALVSVPHESGQMHAQTCTVSRLYAYAAVGLSASATSAFLRVEARSRGHGGSAGGL
jgi:hypothetical protein